MRADGSDATASGFVCPECGGALWERPGDAGAGKNADSRKAGVPGFECRIGHRYEAARLWVEHCAARNRALQAAARSLAENAALARRLAGWTREQGNAEAAVELEREAAEEDRLYEQVQRMVGGLPEVGYRDSARYPT